MKKIGANDMQSAPTLVPAAGVEPARRFHRGILSPLRLPIPPYRHIRKGSRRRSAPLVFKFILARAERKVNETGALVLCSVNASFSLRPGPAQSRTSSRQQPGQYSFCRRKAWAARYLRSECSTSLPSFASTSTASSRLSRSASVPTATNFTKA